jgi:hypothetical protein
MIALDKRGRSPILNCVAGGTLAVVWPALELALVLVLVTVHTFFVGQRGFEVRAFMTFQTGDILVLASERELGVGMVETVRLANTLPGIGGVAGFARLTERTMVGVLVTSRASLERQADIPDQLSVGRRSFMTLLALQRLMFPGQRITGRRVIEVCQWLPAGDGVALFAVGAQLLVMAIFMTAQASSV